MTTKFLYRRAARLLAAVFCLGLVGTGSAQAPAEGISPQAAGLVKASMNFVASQQQFRVEARNSIEVVLASGQKIQFSHSASQSVQRPNKMRAERTGDVVEQVFVYDGKQLTLFNKADKVYATTAVPGTLEGMLDFARDKLDIVAPAGDLIFPNAYDILMTDVTQGFVVGKAVVAGVRCHHLAFRAPHVDWQIWIEDGPRPLPRKLVITTRDVVNAPQFSVEIEKWDLAPKFTGQTFTFAPGKGVRKIDFLLAGSR